MCFKQKTNVYESKTHVLGSPAGKLMRVVYAPAIYRL